MDFQVSEKMTTMLAMIREFMDREVIPLEGEMLFGTPETLAAGVAAAQAKVQQMGLWAPNHPTLPSLLPLQLPPCGLIIPVIGSNFFYSLLFINYLCLFVHYYLLVFSIFIHYLHC